MRSCEMSQPVRNFVAVLIRNDRIGGLDDVLAEFRREINQRLNISEAKVISARKLEEAGAARAGKADCRA